MSVCRRNIRWLAALASVLALSAEGMAQQSNWVKTGQTGRLIYVPSADGDRIQNFSTVGYGAGKKDIPGNIPVLVRINHDPLITDYRQTIQNAINFVATQPIQANGFRGAVELGPGKFDMTGQLSIAASGVVLRGVGGGDSTATNTHLVSLQVGTGAVDSTPVINIQGPSSGISRGPQFQIVDKRVPVGAQSMRVASTAGFSVGGMVEIFRPSTQAWIEELGMHLIPNGPWSAGDRNLTWHRTITRIEGDRIHFDAPITTAIDAQWGGGTVRTFSAPNVIRNVGVENLRGQSLNTRDENNELRTPTFVRFVRTVDGYVRDVETRHFPYASVFTSEDDGGRHITVDNVHSRLPSGQVTGGRRYTFAMDGEYSLVKNSTADSGRHDFVTGSDVVGPIVFTNSVTTTTRSDSGPHHRWGTGLLFDNVDINGNAINVQNRWNSGTGHGWAGANVVVWNSEANSFIMQSPPTAKSWLIGSTGTINAGSCHLGGDTCAGIYESHGTKVNVGGSQSLYQAQLNDAADIREFRWNGGEGNWNDHLGWNQEVRPGVYVVNTRDYLLGDFDNFVLDPGLNSPDLPYIDPAFASAIAASSPNPIVGFDTAAVNKNVAFTALHPMAGNERVIHAYLAMSMKQSGDEVATDFVQLFDTQPDNRRTFSSLGWASQVNTTTPYVGVIDLGQYLDRLQTGTVNVQLADDVAVDWAQYTVTIATPIADSVGATVFLDGGKVTVNSVLAPVGRVTNGGPFASTLEIAPGGRVRATDDFTQNASGTLTLQIGGVNAGQIGTLQVDDVATINGTFKLELAGNFVPSAGNMFSLVSAGSLIASPVDLSTVLPHLPGDLTWQVNIGATSITAQVNGTIKLGDLNGDEAITPMDWTLFKAGQGSNFQNLSAMQAYLLGDLDGDFDHDLRDFAVFRLAYNNANGSGAFERMLGHVPEPTATGLLRIALLFAAGDRRWRRRASI